jgi:hypothetical protein
MPIIYRGPPYDDGSPSSQPWGSGQGSPLLEYQFDSNNYYLLTLIQDLQTSQTAGISYFVINGNQLFVHLTDHEVLGPYILPTWQPIPVGEWMPDTQYYSNNVVWYNGATYLVTYNHISPATFNPYYQVGGNACYSAPILVCPGNALPINGQEGQVLTVVHPGDGALPLMDWAYVLPPSGIAGDVLVLVTPGTSITPAVVEWAASAGSLSFGAHLVGGADGDILFDSAGNLEGATLSALIDLYFGNIQGSILYRGASNWGVLLPGISGHFLETLGTGYNPVWAPAPGGGGGGADLIVGHSAVIGSPSDALLTSGAGELDFLTIGSGLEIVGGALQASGGGAGLSRTTVVSASDLHTIADTPITVVPAPDAHQFIVVKAVILQLNPGAYPFWGTSGDGLNFTYPGISIDVATIVSLGGFMAAETQTKQAYVPGDWFPPTGTGSVAGEEVLLVGSGNLDAGPIATSSVNNPGAGYAPGDTGTLTAGSADATYQVTTVGGGGAVTGFNITAPGQAYDVGTSGTSPTSGGGDGTFTINVNTVQSGDGDLFVTVLYTLVDSTTGEVVG